MMSCDCPRVCNCGESIWVDDDGEFYRMKKEEYQPATSQEVASFAVKHRQLSWKGPKRAHNGAID